MSSIEERLAKLELAINDIRHDIDYIKGKVDAEANLIKWVIFPLLFIVAALVGIKLVIP